MGNRLRTWIQVNDRLLSGLIILCALTMLGILSIPLFTGSVYVEDDLGTFNLPMRHFMFRCLQAGDSFLWMPDMFCGFYAHGEGQAGMMHPWHYFLYRFLPFQVGFNLELLVNYPLIFLGTFLLLRRWRISNAGALLAAWLFAFCGFNFTNYLHLMMPSVLAHTPWILLAIDVALKTERRSAFVGAVMAVTLLTASQLLLGFPQCVYFSCIIEGVYGLLVLSDTRRLYPVFALGVGKCLAVLIGAVQMLPQMAMANDSIRQTVTYKFMSSGGLHPANLLQVFNAYVFNRHGWMVSHADLWDAPYFSALVPPLLMWGFLRFRQMEMSKRFLWTWISLAVIGMWLAFGEYGLIYHVLYYIPWVNRFRGPGRHIVLFHFSVACLAAVFFMDLVYRVRQGSTISRKQMGLIAIPALISLLIALGATVIYMLPDTNQFSITICHHLAPLANGWFGAAMMIGATGLILLAGRGKVWALPLIVILLMADLSVYGLHHKSNQHLERFLDEVELPPAMRGYRFDPDPRPVTACTLAPIKGYKVVSGYAALYPISKLDYSSTAALRIAGVGWRRTSPYRGFELATAFAQGTTWWPVPDPLPRVRCVTEVRVTVDPLTDVEKIDVSKTALVETPLNLEAGIAGEALLTEDRPGKATIHVNTPTRQLLIFAERFHRGWKARVDGTEVPVLRVNGDFMGCLVEPAQHEVVFTFDPEDFKRGLHWTFVGLSLTGVLGLGLSFRRNVRK